MASPTLGKRKEREIDGEDGGISHGSTLFVSNLPYTATSVDLQTLFSDIAPVRSAFVVTEHGTGVSKGVGYVSFAIKEDAQAAFEQISKDGLSLAGRKVRVQWADQKPKEKKEVGEDSPSKAAKARAPPRPQQPRLPHDPLAVRTIVISGLPASLDSKVLWKKIRKCEGAEKFDWPVEEGNSPTAHVLFTTSNAAYNAVDKLHAHVFKGHLLSVALKKRLEILSKPTAGSSKGESSSNPGSSKSAAPSRASRLIVRNLPWNITEQDLRAVFLPYGPIHSIHIPTSSPLKEEINEEASSSKPQARPRAKGFAFVWMLSKKDAEKAIEGCNGTTVSAGMAESLVSDKQKKKKQRREEKKLKALAAKRAQGAEGDVKEEVAEEGEGELDAEANKAEERVIAVDWALSKDKWQEEKAKLEQEEDEDVDMESDSGSDSSSGESDEESDDEDSHIGVHEDDSDDDDEASQPRSDEEEEEPVKPSLPPPETGNTLFVRNVPYEATEDDLRTLFRAFGPLRYARITLDPATGRSRGTGFACFWNREDADKVVAQSELLRTETTGTVTPEVKKNPFKLPSILTPDPSSTLAQSLVLHGRTLDCVRAVTRDQAGKLKEEGEKARQKADKRNMYLLREGVILPNTSGAASLSAAELERRTSSFNARRALLKSNPSLYISKTRLSIRQLPLFASERALRRLAAHATKAFKAEAAKGDRTPLTADELAVDAASKEEEDGKGEEAEDKKSKDKKKGFSGGKRPGGVKQAKIVRQAERVDAITGKSRSKGYGFLEMYSHADALRVLRWANNNPDVAALFDEWWKDEVKDLLKVEEAKKDREKDEVRITRMKKELEKKGESGVEKKSRGNLIIEFSIENVQVVQRRSAVQAKSEGGEMKGRKRKQDSEQSAERPAKRTKATKEAPAPETQSPQPKAKEVNPIGSIIGRKRKQRKGGKKP